MMSFDIKELRTASQNEKSYSLANICLQRDISYEQLMKQEKIDTRLHSELEICRLHCFYNAANLTNNLANRIALNYMRENNQDFKNGFKIIHEKQTTKVAC